MFLCSLAAHDVVITTYNTVGIEGQACDNEDEEVWLSGVCLCVTDTEGVAEWCMFMCDGHRGCG